MMVRMHPTEVASLPLLIAYFTGGVVSIGDPPSVVHLTLGPAFGVAWVVMLIVGPMLIAGSHMWPTIWVQAWLRISGGLLVLGALLAYWLGCVEILGWRSFATVIACGLVIATIIMVAFTAGALRGHTG